VRTGIARVLQVLGLSLVLVGLFVGVTVSNVKAELLYGAVGVLLFYGGRYLETGKPR